MLKGGGAAASARTRAACISGPQGRQPAQRLGERSEERKMGGGGTRGEEGNGSVFVSKERKRGVTDIWSRDFNTRLRWFFYRNGIHVHGCLCKAGSIASVYKTRALRQYTGCPKTNGTQVNGYNFVTADSKYLKLCRHKVKILNDKHAKNQVNRTRRTCFTRYRISITIFAKRVLSASHRAGCTRQFVSWSFR